MNYSDMTDRVKEITESAFTAAQLALFFTNVEEKIYTTFDLPAIRKNATSEITLGSPYVTLPSDFLSAYSLSVVNPTVGEVFLLHKDVNFIREAYPTSSVVGLPKHYAQFDDDTFIVGPTPDAYYDVELHYLGFPASITTAGTSWLGDNYPSTLINGALVEAARFMKEEQDVVAMYTTMFEQSLLLLNEYANSKTRKDTYRSGQRRNVQ